MREHATSAQLIEIDDDSAGQRIDNFLIRILKGLPKSRVYRIIRKGEVRINGRRIRPDRRLQAGDKVRIPPVAHLPSRDTAVGHFHDLESLILHESDGLLVINKPAGMAVHGGSGLHVGVIESLRHARQDSKRLELVHRLDRGTSGCLMVARKRSTLKVLQDALRKPGTIRKTYLALVHGDWTGGEVILDEPLLTLSRTGQERFTRVDPAGKEARTVFRPIASSAGVTLVSASPLTGRTHQIRVHSRWARHPLLGDERYGDPALDATLGASQLMLHAWRLDIPALASFPGVTVEAPVNQHMRDFVRSYFNKNIESILKQ